MFTLLVFIKQCITKGHTALTFDDGPSDYTNDIIDILNLNNVKGAFFVSGNRLNRKESQNTIRRIVNEGHILGSHMYSHKIISDLPEELIVNEMKMTSDLIFNITGNYI